MGYKTATLALASLFLIECSTYSVKYNTQTRLYLGLAQSCLSDTVRTRLEKKISGDSGGVNLAGLSRINQVVDSPETREIIEELVRKWADECTPISNHNGKPDSSEAEALYGMFFGGITIPPPKRPN